MGDPNADWKDNTDGADTIYSSHITFNNWTVVNGDDSISAKANSTDILITNSVFYRGLGIAIGSIGQYKDVFETIERVRAENITYYGTLHSLYFKTWTGEQVNYPPNGGGGGLGCTMTLSLSPFLQCVFGCPSNVCHCNRCLRYIRRKPPRLQSARGPLHRLSVHDIFRGEEQLHLVQVSDPGFAHRRYHRVVQDGRGGQLPV
jgi:hypothetical protein